MASKTNKGRKAATVATEQKPEQAATQPNKADILAHIRQTLEQATAAASNAASLQVQMNEKRTGAYTGAVLAGIESGDAATFSHVWNTLKGDIRANVGGIADKLGCKLGKPDKDGKAEFTVPASMQVATSVVLAALTMGIKLVDGGKPRSFGDIRKDKQAAEQKAAEQEAAAKRTPLQTAQLRVAELARALAEGVNAMTEKEANETAKILSAVLKTLADRAPDQKAA